MSEYQRYSLRAVDRPLSAEVQQWASTLSSRCTVTPYSFDVSYSWGDFGGDPYAMLRRGFDMYLYYANWGSRTLAMRLPEGTLDLAAARCYERDDDECWLRVQQEQDGSVLVEMAVGQVDEMAGYDPAARRMDEIEHLMPLRAMLLQGDLRPLYVGWLAVAEQDEVEPPVPAGLGEQCGELAHLAAFLDVEADALAVAGQVAAPLGPPRPDGRPDGRACAQCGRGSLADVTRWTRALPATSKDEVLATLLCTAGGGPDDAAVMALRASYLEQSSSCERCGPAVAVQSGGERTRGALRAQAGRLRQERLERVEQQRRVARRRQLAALGVEGQDAWDRVRAELVIAKPAAYDRAERLLRPMRELAELDGRLEEFGQQVRMFMLDYTTRPALMERLRRYAR